MPNEEFCVPLDSYRSEHKNTTNSHTHACVLTSIPSCRLPNRSELCLRPVTEDDADQQEEQFDCSEGFSYEDVSNLQPQMHLSQKCRRRGAEGGVLMVNIVPVKDTVTFKQTGGVGEHFDVPFVLHLWPSILLWNLLPYQVSYQLKVLSLLGANY